MRKLWVKAWMTLDGVFDADTMDYWWQNTNSPERMRYITEEYANGDAYLLGRVTYEMLWPGWSTQTTGDGPGPILNGMHKYVVSTTLSAAPWKESTIISGNVVEAITKWHKCCCTHGVDALPQAATGWAEPEERITRNIVTQRDDHVLEP